MAFVTVAPQSTFVRRTTIRPRQLSPRRAAVRCDAESDAPGTSAGTGPTAPKDFVAPQPRRFFIRPDRAGDIVTGSLGTLLRGGSGALIEGYRVSRGSGALVERSATLPETRPRLALRLFEFEACPFCRKVREAVSLLDLDVLVFPCPKDGSTYRPYVAGAGGKAQFPYVEDPNTGWAGYESADIIDYLYKTYGPQTARSPPLLGPFGTFSAGMASMFRYRRGSRREPRVVPAAMPLELYAYEPSPFSKVVRERMVELELPYLLRTTPRGSPTRQKLKDLTGTFQVPYLIDRNTGISMFESADIVDYLTNTYGPDAPGAVEKPAEELVFLPEFTEGSDGLEVWEAKREASVNPTQATDKALEAYCADNPEADECRVYED